MKLPHVHILKDTPATLFLLLAVAITSICNISAENTDNEVAGAFNSTSSDVSTLAPTLTGAPGEPPSVGHPLSNQINNPYSITPLAFRRSNEIPSGNIFGVAVWGVCPDR